MPNAKTYLLLYATLGLLLLVHRKLQEKMWLREIPGL